MSQLLKTATTVLVFALIPKANAQSSSQYYPDAALIQVYSQEQLEQKKADELEQKAIQQRDLYEKRKREVEREISAHRYKIEGLKMQQDKAQQELDLLSVDLQHVKGDLASYQSEHQQLEDSSKATITYLEGQRKELAQKQKALDEELKALAAARKKSEKEIYGLAIEIERFKTEIAKSDTKLQEAEAKRAGLEADEMKIRGEWMETKLALAEHVRQRTEALANLADAKKRLDEANKELASARVEMAKSEKLRNETNRRVQSEVAKYEHDITQANKSRIAAEAERIRLESESTKIIEYGSRMKDNRDQTVEQQVTAEGLVLKSSLALESARTALSKQVNDSDQAQFKAEKEANRVRGLANAEETSRLLSGRVWITTENCKAYTSTNMKTPAGFFDAGRKLLAKDHGSRFVEVMNGSGSSVFMESRCGNYDN